MREFLSWLKNNLSHMFSVVGIVLTVYFSIFYVPRYSEDIRLKKVEGVNGELVGIIQELVFSKHEIDLHDINTLIKGKELRDNIEYPYTVDQLLIQVQERFLENKFIPLASRKELVDDIDFIRGSIKPKLPIDELKEDYSNYNILSLIMTVLGLGVSLFGIFSLFYSAKNQREKEIEEMVVSQKEVFQHRIKRAFALEEFVGRKLENIYGEGNVEREGQPDVKFDYLVKSNGKPKFAVEVKFTDADFIPLRTINQIGVIAKNLSYPVVLVTNAALTKNAKYKFEKINAELDRSGIYIVSVDEIEGIDGIFNKNHSDSVKIDIE